MKASQLARAIEQYVPELQPEAVARYCLLLLMYDPLIEPIDVEAMLCRAGNELRYANTSRRAQRHQELDAVAAEVSLTAMCQVLEQGIRLRDTLLSYYVR